jgi:hypothetical protein
MRRFIFNFRKTGLFCLFTACSMTCYSFDETKDTDVRALSLGQIRALGGAFYNPSSMSFAEHAEVGAMLYKRFNMNELSTRAGYGYLPNRFLDAGLQLSYFGYEDYNITQVQACVSKKIASGLAFGAGFVYRNENSFLEADNRNFFSADAGLSGNIGEYVNWGLLAENLLHTEEYIPTICSAGIALNLLENCTVMVECSYDFSDYFNTLTGIEYSIAKQFIVRGGYNSNQNVPSLGLAYEGSLWKVETAFMLHPLLGMSSAVGIGFFF